MRNMIRLSPRFFLAILSASPWLGTLSSCGGTQKEVETVDAEDDADRAADSTAHIGATAEIGALPEEDSVYAFRESFEAIQECFVTGAQRLEFIGGEISFQVWVDAEGKVQTVFAQTSTLGDRRTEECMYDVLRNAPWPKPVGGPIGVAQNAFEFEMTGDVRPPVPWDGSEVAQTLAANAGQIAECKQGSQDPFVATVYVDTDGSALSVGIAAPSREDADNGRCLVDLLAAASYPSPGSWPAKVSFQL